jgi:hypothetical protein
MEDINLLKEEMNHKEDIENAENISNMVNDLLEKLHGLEKNGTSPPTEPPKLIQRVSVGANS